MLDLVVSQRARVVSLHARTWLVTKGKSADAVCNDLDLRQGMAARDVLSFALVGAGSDAGWYLIVAEGLDHRLIQEPVLTKLSSGCEVLTCTVEERNLFSAATGWQDGRRLWSVTYDGEEVPGEVVAEGELPFAYEGIRRNFTAKAAAEDAGDLLLDPLFEIPVEIRASRRRLQA